MPRAWATAPSPSSGPAPAAIAGAPRPRLSSGDGFLPLADEAYNRKELWSLRDPLPYAEGVSALPP